MPRKLTELDYPSIGSFFGELKVIDNIPIIGKTGQKRFKCECKCGNIILQRLHDLKKQKTKRCKICRNLLPKVPRKSTMLGKYLSMSIFNRFKIEANRRKIYFNLSVSYLEKLLEDQNFKCTLSGIPLLIQKENRTKEQRKIHTLSLDRIDSTKGYIEGNVQFVHKDINYMKWKFEQSYFIYLCKLISER